MKFVKYTWLAALAALLTFAAVTPSAVAQEQGYWTYDEQDWWNPGDWFDDDAWEYQTEEREDYGYEEEYGADYDYDYDWYTDDYWEEWGYNDSAWGYDNDFWGSDWDFDGGIDY